MNNKETLDFIKELSLKDKKTLTEKLGKVTEEAGELARVTLPFDNIDGTTHRFIEKEKILEESVDVILSAISMAYELGYTHEDIDEMMWNKAQKWHGIQNKESKVEYPIPYEIHVTIKPRGQAEIPEFQMNCNIISNNRRTKIKPIVLDLENSGESVMKDIMTSSHFYGDNKGAYEEAKMIEENLKRFGHNVVRVKIETVPWHPAAPSEVGDEMPKDCYFEAHIGCIITPEEKEILQDVAENHGAHLSRNFFKKLEDGKFVNMLTFRSYDDLYDEFERDLEEIKKELNRKNINFEKVITEFSIYDTKVSHDTTWLTGEKQEENA
jgi:NTP pyrophosphatase (non-canonical NTP hydrolase)